ncbi:MAG: hypothetical protein ACJ8DZ_11155 [Allosphingosinicella sp.]
MLILVPFFLLLAAPAAPTPAPPAPSRRAFPACAAGPTLAQRPPRAERPQKLGELPPGRIYHAVVRSVEGCPIPAMSELRLER